MQAIAFVELLFFFSHIISPVDDVRNDEIWYKIASNQKWKIIDFNSIFQAFIRSIAHEREWNHM